MRRIFALLMLLILASAPILDGGCFTSRLVTGGRKEYWWDLHGPCAAYVGADRSLTLVLPDRNDLSKARFFAVKFTPEEVAKAAQKVEGRTRFEEEDEGAPKPNAGNTQWRAPDPGSAWHPPAPRERREAWASPLVFTLSRDGARVSPLPGIAEAQWAAALPAGGYWIHAGPRGDDTPLWNGFSSRSRYSYFDGPFLDPRYQSDHWNLCIAQSGGWLTYCQVRREGGTYLAPSSEMFLLPVTLVLDAVTLPVQLVLLIP